MSWSTQRIGRAKAVAKMIKEDLSKVKCSEPEESIKNSVADLIEHACAAFPDDHVVKVTANGSQYAPNHLNPTKVVNSVNVEVQPIHGFVEGDPA